MSVKAFSICCHKFVGDFRRPIFTFDRTITTVFQFVRKMNSFNISILDKQIQW